jgi:hypothetical protein
MLNMDTPNGMKMSTKMSTVRHHPYSSVKYDTSDANTRQRTPSPAFMTSQGQYFTPEHCQTTGNSEGLSPHPRSSTPMKSYGQHMEGEIHKEHFIDPGKEMPYPRGTPGQNPLYLSPQDSGLGMQLREADISPGEVQGRIDKGSPHSDSDYGSNSTSGTPNKSKTS